ncbi:hypothetical protein GCM10011507_28830 [Edaphobacter acidisoli]|uniref:Potassium channel domain-containing protein n=1 Tax=Edaphobacter acidisoli TaxID=2040573 RepID=A0A916W804_9BACT|nr:ion channel [Edaphobacter acidisoli]GGA75703.1 hypothetical protein GCM10011507_28830 [Edaphobacter acidisoli]
MHAVALIAGLLCCLSVALDAFQTIILPRRPTGRFQITHIFLNTTWAPWAAVTERMKNAKRREQVYSVYGPLSLLLLLLVWALLLVLGFGLFFFAMGSPFADSIVGTGAPAWTRFGSDLYVSGTTLGTLGLGDVLPRTPLSRAVVISEAVVGLGFVALVIGYLPVLYQAFSRREVSIVLLDARAGSPPTAAELLRRHDFAGGEQALELLLAEWERWSAEILESHISYPILCYYRSQHDNQSWLSALVAILDTCALLISVLEGTPSRQAQLTFVMARHALIDLGQVFGIQQKGLWQQETLKERMSATGFNQLCGILGGVHLRVCGDPASARRLHTIRALYEPHALALAAYLRMPLPVWVAEPRKKDQWSLLTKLRSEADTVLNEGNEKGRAASAILHADEHGH